MVGQNGAHVVGLGAFQAAVEDLIWRFQSADSAIGIHGQAFDEPSNHVFDEETSRRRHLRLRDAKHRRAVDRIECVDASLVEVGWAMTRRLQTAFSHVGRSALMSRLDGPPALLGVFSVPFGSGSVCLLGTALQSSATREAFTQDSFSLRRASDSVVEWLEKVRANDKGLAFLRNLRDQAEREVCMDLAVIGPVLERMRKAQVQAIDALREVRRREIDAWIVSRSVVSTPPVRAKHASNLTELSAILAKKVLPPERVA